MWAKDATLLTKGMLRSMVLEACELVGEAEVDILLEALWYRTRHGPQLVEEYLARIEASS